MEDDYYGSDDYDASFYTELYQLELDGFGPSGSATDREPNQAPLQNVDDLRRAAQKSQSAPFFTRQTPFDYDLEDDPVDINDDAGDAPAPVVKKTDGSSQKAWFTKPKRMSDCLYQYFATTIQPLIFRKKGTHLAEPKCYVDDRPSFWVNPPDPVFTLSRHRLDPILLYRPRVFLWLPHFFVTKLLCPKCGKKLEKNGAVAPRRVTDLEDSFYIVTWAYYCREGCQAYFHGWNQRLLRSLPAFLRLTFPAVLSHQSGLSHNVLDVLRVGNQHKMGPSGVRSLLLEMHTRRFNVLQLQYLETIFEQQRGLPAEDSTDTHTLYNYMPRSEKTLPSFGGFDDPQGYGGFVPSEHYLSDMMNKAIELDEANADQLTGCLDGEDLSADDSHKIVKHIAKYDGVPIFTALWTCMAGPYIRTQVLTATKSHEERIGPLKAIAESFKTYGHEDPKVIFSDDPVKDRALFYGAFSSLSQKLTPIATAHGLEALELANNVQIKVLDTPQQVEGVCHPLIDSLDKDPKTPSCVSIDAEWNISRKLGVSVIQLAPHSMPQSIFIIPVHKFKTLPLSLLRLLISNQVFKIGVGVKGDLTRLKKQFPQLSEQGSFNVIDLKEYAIQRGIIGRQDSGALDALVEKVLGKYLTKDDAHRRSEDWELKNLNPDMKSYAALDVFASRLVFEEISKVSPIDTISINSPAGTRVVLLVHEGGAVAAYGKISAVQPSSFAGIRVYTPNRNRVLVDVDTVTMPSAAAIFHQLPESSGNKRTAAGAYTFGQLQSASSLPTFSVVMSVSLLTFDRCNLSQINTETDTGIRTESSSAPSVATSSAIPEVDMFPSTAHVSSPDGETELNDEDSDSDEGDWNHGDEQPEDDISESVQLQMLQAHSEVHNGKKRQIDGSCKEPSTASTNRANSDFLLKLQHLIEAPPDTNYVYTRIKKDIFHAFRMIPMHGDHGMRLDFTRALRDHLMRWDPVARSAVDKVCREKFNRTFEQMLERNPQYIKKRVPRHVPQPSVLVPAIQHVYDMFGNAPNAKNREPLFTKEARKKADAVLDLAREGYLSDPDGVTLYEKAGIDENGLTIWACKRGTNNVEGGPHGDIYRKFGALHAGPRLTVNCLQDHRVFFNLQAWAKHVYGVDWQYHHNIGIINRTSFLLNYLSDLIDGAESYSGWFNGDLYERTHEKFGICPIPESIRIRLAMEPFSEDAAKRYPLNRNDDWLRKKQKLALPTLPPTTPEARKYFFSQMRVLAGQGDGKINYEAFAKQWNCSADGKERFYVTTEVLMAYAKTWDKSNNIKASRELNSDNMELTSQSRQVFAAPQIPIPSFITGIARSSQPTKAVLDLDAQDFVPDSISTTLAISRPRMASPPRPPTISRERGFTSISSACLTATRVEPRASSSTVHPEITQETHNSSSSLLRQEPEEILQPEDFPQPLPDPEPSRDSISFETVHVGPGGWMGNDAEWFVNVPEAPAHVDVVEASSVEEAMTSLRAQKNARFRASSAGKRWDVAGLTMGGIAL
ncbi:hypothetical protein DFH06DRAFT_1445903 [Mycena polygramma]|nr:hypothetical protein DFH06DRAFT_1445903 [Mycena polygramma]